MSSLQRGVNLKDEEEVKQYLENLGTEYRFSCYYEKNPSGCHLLGDYMAGIKRDPASAFRLYLENCEQRRHAHSCHKVAGYIGEGEAPDREKDVDVAYDYFRRACDHGFAMSCFRAAQLDFVPSEKYPRRKGRAKPENAPALFKRACDMGNVGESCHNYSMLCRNHDGADARTSFAYAVKGCQNGFVQACQNVSRMYAAGMGCKRDMMKSRVYAALVDDMHGELDESRRTQNFSE